MLDKHNLDLEQAGQSDAENPSHRAAVDGISTHQEAVMEEAYQIARDKGLQFEPYEPGQSTESPRPRAQRRCPARRITARRRGSRTPAPDQIEQAEIDAAAQLAKETEEASIQALLSTKSSSSSLEL